MTNPLDIKIFYQQGVFGKNIQELSVREALNDIFKGKYKMYIDILRQFISEGNKDMYNIKKKNLPAVTFSATFHNARTTKEIKSYTKLLVLDIDDLRDESEVVQIETICRSDKHVISCWRSPSNLGLKGLIYLDYEVDFPLEQSSFFHESAFKVVEDYFSISYGIKLDTSGKDVTRLCFVSHDASLFYNKNFEKFKVSLLPTIKEKGRLRSITLKNTCVDDDKLYNPKGKNNPLHRKEIKQVIKFLVKRNLSITFSNNDWLEVARSIVSTFTFDIGIKYFQTLSKQDQDKYNEEECTQFLKKRYLDTTGSYTFATILYLANRLGYNKRGEVPKMANESKGKGVVSINSVSESNNV